MIYIVINWRCVIRLFRISADYVYVISHVGLVVLASTVVHASKVTANSQVYCNMVALFHAAAAESGRETGERG